MIASFGDEATEDVFHGIDSKDARRIPKALWPAATRKLDMLNAAQDVLDLKAAPANRLEKLRGSLTGFWSIRVNDQYPVVFKFANGTASDVRIVDYH